MNEAAMRKDLETAKKEREGSDFHVALAQISDTLIQIRWELTAIRESIAKRAL
jgi:hypothetical protein